MSDRVLHMPCGCPYPKIGDHRPCEHGYPGDDDLDDDDESCSWCDGEWWAQECSNPLECACRGLGGHCDACGNTGLARNQVTW